MHSKFVWIAIAGTLGACTELATNSVSSELRCDSWGCGTNSATVGDGILFDELDSAGIIPNASGVVIVGSQLADGTPVHVVVRRHQIIAQSLDGTTEYSHGNLYHLVITLKGPQHYYELRIEDVEEQDLTFWEGPADFVPYYVFRARIDFAGDFKQYICQKDTLSDDPRWTGREHLALAFEWDHYSAKEKTVTELPADTTLFNLACAGTAPAKLHLYRHTRAGGYDALGTSVIYNTTTDQRQVMLKMFTADYCGKGHSFTVDGTPLWFGISGSRSIDLGAAASVEALWTNTGAQCLDTTRLPVAWSDIVTECGYNPLPCGDVHDWASRAYIISVNPPPP